MANKKITSIPEQIPQYQPILDDDGSVKYSSQDVQWCVEDYYRQAEKSIEWNVMVRDYQRARKRGEKAPLTFKPRTPAEERVAYIKSCNDYKWIIQVAKSRNEVDMDKEILIKLHTLKEGKSTYERMVDFIVNVIEKPDATYQEMRKAEFGLKILHQLRSKAPDVATKLEVINNITTYQEKYEKNVTDDTETIDIQNIREVALKEAPDLSTTKMGK